MVVSGYTVHLPAWCWPPRVSISLEPTCPLKSRPGPGQASPLPVSAGCSCHRSTQVQGGVGGVGRWLLVGEWPAGLAREGRGDSISETRDPLPLSVVVEGKACCLHSRLGQGMSFQVTGFRVQIQVLTLTSLFRGLQSYKDVASTDGAPTTCCGRHLGYILELRQGCPF